MAATTKAHQKPILSLFWLKHKNESLSLEIQLFTIMRITKMKWIKYCFVLLPPKHKILQVGFLLSHDSWELPK